MTTKPNTLCQEHDLFGPLIRTVSGVIGLLFLLAGLGLSIREIHFGRTAVSAAGSITEVRMSL